MPSVYIAIVPVMAALYIQIVGNGLITTLVPLRAALEGFSQPEIGAIGSTYFVGMLAGCWTIPPLIGRIGYIRAFSACAALATVCVLGFAIAVHPVAWAVLRGALGFAIAGLYNVMESWVNAKASNANRGRALALYNIVHFSGSATGQQVLRAFEPRSYALFSLGAAFFVLSLVPMAMTRSEPPAPPSKARADVRGLYALAPMGVIGVLVVGLANGTFWSLTPAVIERLQLGAETVANFMTAVIVGSALSPYPVGRLSDIIDRRYVIAGISGAAALLELAIFVTGSASVPLLYALGFGIGATTTVIYPMISAHTNDRSGPEMVVTVASTLLFVYCVGGIVGPVAIAWLMERTSDMTMFLVNAALHVSLTGFVLWRIGQRAAPSPLGEQPAPQSPRDPQKLK